MIGIVALATVIVSQASPVIVEGDACGLRAALPAALARRGLPAPGRPLRVTIDDATIAIARSGDGPVRRVPRSPSCAADLDLVVLIVERQERELSLGAEAEPLPGPPLAWALDVGASGGAEIGERVGGTVELAGRLELLRFAEAVAGLRLGLPSAVDVTRAGRVVGAIEAWSLGGWLGAGVGFDTGRQRIFGGTSVGLDRVSAAADGLFQASDRGVWAWSIGVEGRYELALIDQRLWLSIALGGRFRPGAPAFGVEGSATAYQVPAAALTARAGLWARIF